jgi:hypothetical protein
MQNKEKNMKKILMAAAILAAVLAFLTLPTSQAGAAKPVRWKATFINDGTANLMGTAVFVGGQDQVNINNGVGTNDGEIFSYLELQVFNPSLIFNMGGFLSSSNGSDIPASYGFPGTASLWPFCVADFLNTYPQPTADYPHIHVRFTTCGYPFADLMAMGEGQILPVHMNLMIVSHIWSCPAPSVQKTFLNLYMGAHGHVTSRVNRPFDVYLKRVGNEWTAYVDTIFDNPDYQKLTPEYTSADFPMTISDNILGQYATCSSTRTSKGKTTWATTYHYPWAKAPLKFQIAFTKI